MKKLHVCVALFGLMAFAASAGFVQKNDAVKQKQETFVGSTNFP